MNVLALPNTFVLYGSASGDTDTKPRAEIEKFMVIGWEWDAVKPASPVLLTPLPTVKSTKHLFQLGFQLGYEIGGLTFDLDGRSASRIKMDKDLREEIEGGYAEWKIKNGLSEPLKVSQTA